MFIMPIDALPRMGSAAHDDGRALGVTFAFMGKEKPADDAPVNLAYAC